MGKKSTKRSKSAADQETLVTKSESLAKEHSARRELRHREDRVRRLSSEHPEGSSKRPPPAQKQSEGKTNRKRPPKSPTSSSPKPSGSSGRLSAPFPPLRSKTGTSNSPTSPALDDTGPERRLTATDRMAIELESLLGDITRGWRRQHRSDRICILASMGTILGVFLPWVSLPGRPYQMGLLVGGIIHATLAVSAIALVLKRNDIDSIGASRQEQSKRNRRISIYHILLGAGSTLAGAVFFLIWGIQKNSINIVFHFGVYWTLLCGTGLGYGGFIRFMNPGIKKG